MISLCFSYRRYEGKSSKNHGISGFEKSKLLVLEAQKELSNFLGHFEKLYTSTFDSGASYGRPIANKKMAQEKLSIHPLRTKGQITVFIYYIFT